MTGNQLTRMMKVSDSNRKHSHSKAFTPACSRRSNRPIPLRADVAGSAPDAPVAADAFSGSPEAVRWADRKRADSGSQIIRATHTINPDMPGIRKTGGQPKAGMNIAATPPIAAAPRPMPMNGSITNRDFMPFGATSVNSAMALGITPPMPRPATKRSA